MASPEKDMLFPDALKFNASLTTPLFPLQHYFVELCCTIESIRRFSVYIEITAKLFNVGGKFYHCGDSSTDKSKSKFKSAVSKIKNATIFGRTSPRKKEDAKHKLKWVEINAIFLYSA